MIYGMTRGKRHSPNGITEVSRSKEDIGLGAIKSDVTCSIPEAGLRFFGLGENASYRAAANGDIPYIMVGGRKRAIISAIEERIRAAAEEQKPAA